MRLWNTEGVALLPSWCFNLPSLPPPPLPLSLAYLRSVAGCRTVPVEVGSRYTDEGWSQTLLTLNDFIDDYVLKTV